MSFSCIACRDLGWVFDRLHWPRDHWPEPCPRCGGRGSRFATLLGLRPADVFAVLTGEATPRTAKKVLDAIEARGFLGKESG